MLTKMAIRQRIPYIELCIMYSVFYILYSAFCIQSFLEAVIDVVSLR